MSTSKKRSYKVRFATGNKYQKTIDAQDPSPSPPSLSRNGPVTQRTNSHHGCLECRVRRVKCDETSPVCLRCQRRGSVCMASSRPAQWQIEMPWLSNITVFDSWPGDSLPNKRLVQHWVEQGSQMLCVDRNYNPLALPLLPYLASSPSLLHAIQSISAGQMVFFSGDSLAVCLRERGSAIRLLREDLHNSGAISPVSALTVFLLGMSASWIEPRPDSWGKEHMDGARTLMKLILVDKKARQDSTTQLLAGWYLWWDMACAFLDDDTCESPDQCISQNILSLEQDHPSFHPIIGDSFELYAMVADIGRYCRRVYEHGLVDSNFDDKIEQRLLVWSSNRGGKHIHNLSNAYRNHGLLMLYQTRRRTHLQSEKLMPLSPPTTQSEHESNEQQSEWLSNILSLALEAIENLLEIPLTEPCANFQSLPLLSAAAELTSNEHDWRSKSISQFRMLYSINRVPVQVWSIQLLQEIWALKDSGGSVSWLELCLAKGWKLCFS
ncbi:C6 zinc finger domain-containing protein [Fusarium mexicanum]|uniref:C6 zinc finger domain-containing protein n=1 Tax=Fusarium mexicanum TaxID=751941 RepID=A0A8H5IB58_9HYPO|nr:C6 zinc finger domain-containing protein [Fusarium mexicanum]